MQGPTCAAARQSHNLLRSMNCSMAETSTCCTGAGVQCKTIASWLCTVCESKVAKMAEQASRFVVACCMSKPTQVPRLSRTHFAASSLSARRSACHKVHRQPTFVPQHIVSARILARHTIVHLHVNVLARELRDCGTAKASRGCPTFCILHPERISYILAVKHPLLPKTLGQSQL